MGGDERISYESRRKETTTYQGSIIRELWDRLVELGYMYKDLYEMTLQELMDTLENRRKGLAYEIWRLASLTRSPFIKEFPSSPKEACPELYPIETGIKMPDFLMDKAIKRGVI